MGHALPRASTSKGAETSSGLKTLSASVAGVLSLWYQPRRYFSKGAKPFMKPNVIIALLVGGVVGFAVGRMASGTPGNTGGNQPVAAAPSNPSPSQPAAAP